MDYDSEHDFTITMLRGIANEVGGDNSDLSQTMKDVVDRYEIFRETMRDNLAQKAQDQNTQKTQKQYADRHCQVNCVTRALTRATERAADHGAI